MAITSANQLELLQTAEAVAREKMIDPDLVVEAMEEVARPCRQVALRRGDGHPRVHRPQDRHARPLPGSAPWSRMK